MNELTSYKGKLCTQDSNFVYGDTIKEDVCDLLVDFYNYQQVLPYIEGQCMEGGEIKVNPDYKESRDLHVPFQAAVMHLEPYVNELQRILNIYMEHFLLYPFKKGSLKVSPSVATQLSLETQ